MENDGFSSINFKETHIELASHDKFHLTLVRRFDVHVRAPNRQTQPCGGEHIFVLVGGLRDDVIIWSNDWLPFGPEFKFSTEIVLRQLKCKQIKLLLFRNNHFFFSISRFILNVTKDENQCQSMEWKCSHQKFPAFKVKEIFTLKESRTVNMEIN